MNRGGALIFLIMTFPLLAFEKIDLTRVCTEKTGAPCITWYFQCDFKPEYLKLTTSDIALWKKAEIFPIKLRDICSTQNNQAIAVATFALYFKLPESLRQSKKTIGLQLGGIGEIWDVYANGINIASDGLIEGNRILKARPVRGKTFAVDNLLLNQESNLLLIHIRGDARNYNVGLFQTKDYWIGELEELRYSRRDIAGLILICLYFFVGLYHLLLAYKRKQDPYNLYFGLFCVFIFIYLMTRHDIIFELPLDGNFLQRIELFVLYALVPFMFAFVDKLARGNLGLVTKLYAVFCMTIMIPTPFVHPVHNETILRIWQSSILVPVIYLPFRCIKATLRGNKDAGRLLLGVAAIILTAVTDVLDSAFFHTGWSFTKYGFFIFIIGIAVILANRFLRVHNEVEELNATLEKKVEERTLELQKSLNDVRALKTQQDGDYYLTSLLIHPLGGNYVKSQNVTVDFLVRQKKRFQFRKWEAEIGGDLCTAHTIRLQGRSYTVFLNGDAMGKSIQGAGGALVLGVVFKSVINRTLLSSEAQGKRPERWLKDCFAELQDIFVSFDGTMLISAVLGLVDDLTGATYYINAEHPWVVLYRDGKAQFIESELLLRKIGIEGLEGRMAIKTFQLKPDDVLFVGSDGRDDLSIAVNEKGQRIINEDEYEFLRHVEKGRGLLAEIDESIRSKGELTDDFTLIRIGYAEDRPLLDVVSSEDIPALQEGKKLAASGNFQDALKSIEAALSEHPQNADLFEQAARSAQKLRKSEKAAELWLKYLEINPLDLEALYNAACMLKLTGRYLEAADLGESIRLREPDHVRNLIHLADSHRLLKQHGRAKKILEEARAIAPEDPDIAKLAPLIK